MNKQEQTQDTCNIKLSQPDKTGSCETLKEKWSSSRKEKSTESKAILWSIHQIRKSEVDFGLSAKVDDRATGQATGYLSHDHQGCTYACSDFNGQLAV